MLLPLIAIPILLKSISAVNQCHELLCGATDDDMTDCRSIYALCTIPRSSNWCKYADTLVIRYQSCDNHTVQFNSSMLTHYHQLNYFKLIGGFSEIDVRALSEVQYLETFELHGTNITSLPHALFKNNLSLKTLIFVSNGFREIPEAVFTLGESLEELHFSENSEVLDFSSENESLIVLPRGFIKLPKLTSLSLVGLQIKNREQVGDDFFKPVIQLKSLNLSFAGIFHGSQKLLLPLENLEKLTLIHVEPYCTCPRNSTNLLANLPKNLKWLELSRWSTALPMMENCTLTSKSLDGIRNLPLEYLAFNYSDYVFGSKLDGLMFKNMTKLVNLDIRFCRLIQMDEEALHNLPALQILSLSGNPFGPRQFNPFPDNMPSNLTSLYLRGVSLWSDISQRYDMTKFLNLTPSIQFLDISSNYLQRMPTFSSKVSSRQMHRIIHKYLTGFRADDNELLTVFQLEDHDTTRNVKSCKDSNSNPCPMFPALTNISLARNEIYSLRGLCPNLTNLNLANNRLSEYSKLNMECLREQHRLQQLELSGNNFRFIEEDMLVYMIELRNISLSHNKLSEIPVKLFRNNLKLKRIDLSWNSISSISTKTFSHLQQLEILILSVNSFSSLPKKLINFLQESPRFIYLDLDGNGFDCRCRKQYFQDWIKSTEKVAQRHRLRCSVPSAQMDEFVHNYTSNYVQCNMEEFGWPIIAALISLLGVILIVLPCYRYWWYIKHTCVVLRAIAEQLNVAKREHDCEYDAYVSFDDQNEDDALWVINQMIPALENETTPESNDDQMQSVRLYIKPRDSTTGELEYLARQHAVDKSRKIIIVLSNSYICSAKCLEDAEFLLGQKMLSSQVYQPDRVITILREELVEDNIIDNIIVQLLVGNVCTVYGTTQRQMSAAWEKVRRFLNNSRFIYSRSVKHRVKKQKRKDCEEDMMSMHDKS